MRCSYTLLLFALSVPGLVVMAGASRPADASPPTATAEIDRLIQQLGSAVPAERKAAAKKLQALGAPALAGLQQALKSGDAEIQRSARQIIAAIERQIALAPTKVHVQAKATPLAEVVRDLMRQSKISLFLDQEPADLWKRAVTLDTGETSFWEALDALCRQARIHLRPDAQTLGPTSGLNAEEALRREYQLVLQDGLLPESLIAYAGCLRVRLRPDPYRLAKEGVRTNDQWIVEVLSEPKLQWQGPLRLSLEEPRGRKGEKVGAAPEISENTIKEEDDPDLIPGASRYPLAPGGGHSLELVVGWPAGVRPFESDSQNKEPAIVRQEYPITWSLPAGTTGTPITLQGKLQGEAVSPSTTVITVAEASKNVGKRIEGKDGFGLTVQQWRRKADGMVEMQLKVETEKRPWRTSPFYQLVEKTVKPIMDVESGNVPGLKSSVDGKSLGLYAWDTKGRQYTIAASLVCATNGVTTYHLTLKPPAKGSEFAKLERHAPFSFAIDQTFTLRPVRPR